MATRSGFGKAQPQPKVSKRSTERAEAVKQYDQLKSDGIPDFEIYIRIIGKKAWYPVGSIAVKRSDQINQAIFSSQDELLQGAFRLFPILKKHQTELEYGHRLKEYKDEPIQLAVPPQSGSGGMQTLTKPFEQAIARVKNGLTALFPKR
jgi:hypothetical protein